MHLDQQQDALLHEFVQLAAARRRAGQQAEEKFQAESQSAKQQLEARRATILGRYEAEKGAIEQQFAQARGRITGELGTQYAALDTEYQTRRKRAQAAYQTARTTAKRVLHEARWEAQAIYEARRPVPGREFNELQRQIGARREQVAQVEDEFYELLITYRQPRERPEKEQAWSDQEPPQHVDDAPRHFQQCAKLAEEELALLKALRLPKLFQGLGPLWPFVAAALLIVVPVGAATSWSLVPVTISALAALVLAVLLTTWLYLLSKRRVDHIWRQFSQTIGELNLAADLWTAQALARCRRQEAEIRQKYDADVQRAEAAAQQARGEYKARRQSELAQADEQILPRLETLKRQREEQLRDIEQNYPQQVGEVVARRDEQLQQTQHEYEQQREDIWKRHEEAWQSIAAQWQQGVARLDAGVAKINQLAARLFPDWHDERAWSQWQPSETVPPVLPIGRFEVSADQLPGVGAFKDRLKMKMPATMQLPALLTFPERCSLLLKTSGPGRAEAVDAIQAVMLRMLASLPPGKVRFTIVDPVGLGQNFAGFMHLADFDEKLVNSRIWAEPQFIEKRLADLTSHMSTVIQKYLRNEYDTIEQYNEQAGEVAEPYRVLVVANFPFNFTDAAAKHLLSIISSGPRCGVYTLISVDMKQRVPQGFNVADLEQNCIKLVWKDDQFLRKDGQWDNVPIALDKPPPSEKMTEILHAVGERALEGSRVEVPFEFIAPPDDQWWAADSSRGIDVALGRAGATKRQRLQLGSGTSQHVLIAGKTGSGKSTLLHALVTNTALTYAPDEVELYLVDFKKGVEFKTYATHELPHARVIAIESEREFGLSVLQRLDAELKRRGDRFRDVGAQDVGAYRQATGEKVPRILLIVDEFQEFFVEDDKIAQETSLLLDRLVRQGRAFGIHVHLGSQTLGGAYSLARSTLGQMAVRVALQCSEADAHLILSEDNPAARLLARPGEAIYNDANGRVEGNHLFQVVWLPDERREAYLQRLREMARERNFKPAQPQIVFEGNIPADIRRNHLLVEALEAREAAEGNIAWLGEAIAIKDPTSVQFRRQSGSHMIVVGQQAEPAMSLMASSLLSLAAQHAPASDAHAGGAAFYVLDGTQADSPLQGYFETLGRALPHSVRVGGVRDAAAFAEELSAEVQRRQTEGDLGRPELFLFIYDLQRFRELRRAEDDFGFSREEKPSPAKQLGTIVREGPSLGIHVIAWSDTLNNLNRTLDRQGVRELELRVLFQMSQTDSATLIDSPAAAKVGMHRALLFSEELGAVEKFRPYSLPSAEWLTEVGKQLASRPAPTNGSVRHEKLARRASEG